MRDRLLVLIAALAAFGFTIAGSFHFDDFALFSDRAIVSPWGWIGTWRPLQTRPLTYFTFWLNYRISGADPLSYHVVGLALHIGCALLVLAVLKGYLAPPAALIAALLFAVHPIQTEAVAYVFARATVLSTLLALVSWWYWSKGRAWLAVAWFAAALLAKEECAAFPLFLLVLDRRARRGPIAAMLALSLAAGLRVMWAASVIHEAGAGASAGISPLAYLSMQGVAIARYLRMLVIPWGFTVDPDIGAAPILRAAAWAAAIAAVALALRFRRAGLWFLAGLLLLAPSSSIFPAADLAVDRRLYLPMIAFSAAIAIVVERRRREALAIVIGALIVVSVRYSLVWKSESSLWTEALIQSPGKVRPRIHLARTLDPPHALALLEQARRLAPANPDVLSEEGRVYLESGRPADALAAFGRALALTPGDANAVNNRGAALQALGQADAAKSDFERALRMDPCLAGARRNLERLGGQPPRADCP